LSAPVKVTNAQSSRVTSVNGNSEEAVGGRAVNGVLYVMLYLQIMVSCLPNGKIAG
jgi:hypothetical protein